MWLGRAGKDCVGRIEVDGFTMATGLGVDVRVDDDRLLDTWERVKI